MPPKAKICYICGRPTLLPGYAQHVVQCKALYEKREMAKPPKERRPLPPDPSDFMGSSNLDEFNDEAMKSWQKTLVPCSFCGRKFLPDKLAIHNRSCTASNPAKRVGQVASSNDNYDRNMEYDAAPPRRSGYERSERNSYDIDSADYEMGKMSLGGRTQDMGSVNQYSSSGKYSQPSKVGAKSSKLDQYNEFPTYAALVKCPDCGRNFNPVSFEKHSKICRKVFLQHRKPFDSAKHRAMGTELAAYQSSTRRNNGKSTQRESTSNKIQGTQNRRSKGMPTWKEQSLSFREAIRQAKLVSQAESKAKATGIPLHRLLPPPSMRSVDAGPPSDYVQCPTCGRNFNQKAGARHIPQCKNIINKPSRLVRHSGHSAVTYASPPSHQAVSPRSKNTYDDYDQQSFGNSRSRTYDDYGYAGKTAPRVGRSGTNSRKDYDEPPSYGGGGGGRGGSSRMQYDEPPSYGGGGGGRSGSSRMQYEEPPSYGGGGRGGSSRMQYEEPPSYGGGGGRGGSSRMQYEEPPSYGGGGRGGSSRMPVDMPIGARKSGSSKLQYDEPPSYGGGRGGSSRMQYDDPPSYGGGRSSSQRGSSMTVDTPPLGKSQTHGVNDPVRIKLGGGFRR